MPANCSSTEVPFVHPTSELDPDVSVGYGTKIWQLCHIRKGATVGCECILGRGVFVNTGARIGNRVKIQNYVHVAGDVTLEDGVFVGPHVNFIGDKVPRAVNPDMSLKSKEEWTQGKTLVCEGASIGSNSTILCDLVIGKWAMVAAGSVVTHDVPDHAKVAGSPARIVGWVCVCGKPVSNATEGKKCAHITPATTNQKRRKSS